MELSEGITPTEVILLAFDGELLPDEVFVLPVEAAEPVGSVDKAVFVDCTALAGEPTPLPHPEPQKAKVIRKKKNRKNGKLCG
jgi:hypothetical protein